MLHGGKREPVMPADCIVFATKKVSLSSTQTHSATPGDQAGKASGRIRAQLAAPARRGVPASGTPSRTPVLLPGKPPL